MDTFVDATISNLVLEDLWAQTGFTPNPNQQRAIEYVDGPLFLPAGPGSGKTRVLLWRTLNLIVFHDVKPEQIFLSTFTEKAALQLQEGLRALLSVATSRTGQPYDISRMYIGTVHSLCRRLLGDRSFSADYRRPRVPVLLDQVDQYFFMSRRRHWEALLTGAGLDLEEGPGHINSFFGSSSPSKYQAVQNCITLFNRFSEEAGEPAELFVQTEDARLQDLITLYQAYLEQLKHGQPVVHTDLSLVQQLAYRRLEGAGGAVFKHVIIDEYQDTNTIQERLYFKLAEGHRNLCVVGDDDQALYRFRGATVENFVEFAERCRTYLGCEPAAIPLDTNYRSRKKIVEFYKDFIERCDWGKADGSGEYRVSAKKITAHSQDAGPAVVVTAPGKPEVIFAEIAALVRKLVDKGKVSDPNQVAFLFPSLQWQGQMTTQVQRMKEALEAEGFLIYAPRAGRFLDVEESVKMFGLIFHVIGKPSREADYDRGSYKNFFDWLDGAYEAAELLIEADPVLRQFVQDQQAELKTAVSDYRALQAAVAAQGWELSNPYETDKMREALEQAPGLSEQARRLLSNQYFERVVERRLAQGQSPITLKYVIARATSLDWTLLDLFYRLCGFSPFREMFDLAETGQDEGPVCNLSLISQQIARFVDQNISLIGAQLLADGMLLNVFVMRYLYSVYRMGESEYEDREDPFPKGRIPFLTIHQSKGLEFPVVVLPNLRKRDQGPQFVEQVVRPLLERPGEPLERVGEFDIMRQFYVALSRAQNLLVLGHLKGQGQTMFGVFKAMLAEPVPRIAGLDIESVPPAETEHKDLPKNYSYTGDYLLYRKCPRQYMLFKKYGFAPSATETMVFGSVIHQTLEDLHQLLIRSRRHDNGTH